MCCIIPAHMCKFGWSEHLANLTSHSTMKQLSQSGILRGQGYRRCENILTILVLRCISSRSVTRRRAVSICCCRYWLYLYSKYIPGRANTTNGRIKLDDVGARCGIFLLTLFFYYANRFSLWLSSELEARAILILIFRIILHFYLYSILRVTPHFPLYLTFLR